MAVVDIPELGIQYTEVPITGKCLYLCIVTGLEPAFISEEGNELFEWGLEVAMASSPEDAAGQFSEDESLLVVFAAPLSEILKQTAEASPMLMPTKAKGKVL